MNKYLKPLANIKLGYILIITAALLLSIGASQFKSDTKLGSVSLNHIVKVDSLNLIPAAPTNLAIPSPTREPVLTWTASAGATSYNVYRNGTNIGSSAGTTYTDASASSGSYTYYVTAVNTAGESAGSNSISVTVNSTAPTLTYSISPSPNGAGWNNAPTTVTFNCAGYPNSHVDTTTVSSPVTVTSQGLDQPVTGTCNDKNGSYSVTVYISLDESAPTLGTPNWSSNPVSPGQSATLSVPASEALSGVIGGEYYVGNSDPGIGNGTPMTWDGNNLTASIVSSLTPGVYPVNIRAENAANVWSSVITTNLVVGQLSAVPAAPTDLNIPSPTDAPSLSWTASVGATSYNIYCDGVNVGSTTNTTYTDTSEAIGDHTYFVTAVDGAGESTPSNSVDVSIVSPPPAAPTNLSAPALSNAPNLTWTASDGATSYNVYRDGVVIGSTTNTSYLDNSATNGFYTYYVTAVDNSGEGSPSNSVSVNVFTNPPFISYSLTPAANTAGWNNSTVTVNFICDAASREVQIVSCPAPVTLTNQGADQIVTGTTVDTAGNTASVTATINIDESTPTVGTPVWDNDSITAGQSANLTVPASESVAPVVGGEYYIGDTDPGLGLGTPMLWDGTNLSASIGSDLTPGTYQINIRALDSAGNWGAVTTTSLVVNPLSVAPPAPTDLSIPTPTNAPVLSWNGMSGASSYNIYRDGVDIGSTTSTTYTDTSASFGTHTYYVTAVDTYGESTPSNSVTLNVVPAAPANLTIPTPTNAPVLTWTASAGATSYNIYRDGVDVGSTSNTTYADNVSVSSGYTYYVTAVDAYGESAASNSVFINAYVNPPTISYQLSPAPNTAGWNNSAVTITFYCNPWERYIPVVSCTAPVTITNPGANQTVTGTVVDSVGNTASVTATINLDESAPTLGTPSWSANPIATGQSASLTVPALDNLSGVVSGEYYIGSADPGQGNATPMVWDGTNLTASIGSNLTPGTYQINVRAEDAAGNWSSVTTTNLVVVNPATITSANSTTFDAQTISNFTVTTAGGNPTPQLSETGKLPSGITFTDNGNGTASLSGQTSATAGNYPITINANNGINTSQSFVLTIKDVNSTPTITSANTYTATAGTAFSFTVNTTGYPTNTITKSAGTLPSGVSLVNNSNNTATISGIPGANTNGVYSITIQAKNSQGTITQAFNLVVDHAPSLATIATQTATVDAAYSQTITSTNGYPYPVMTVSGLPNGLSYVDNGNGTASVSGTPAAGDGGKYTVTVTATNSVGTATTSYTLTVDAAPTITSANTTTVVAGSALSFQVTATGYPAPTYTETGTLPAGVSFNKNTGLLSGTPKASAIGTYSLTITATNSTGSNSQTFSLVIDNAPTLATIASQTAIVGTAYSQTIISTGGYPTTAIVVTGLPSGLTYVDNGNGTASISGTPTANDGGAYTVTVTATNSVGTATTSYTLTVNSSPTITSANTYTATAGTAFSFTVNTTGYPTNTITKSAGTLPSGVSLVNNSNNTATISGTPGANTNGVYSITIQAKNSQGTITQAFNLVVDHAPSLATIATQTATVDAAYSQTITSTNGYPYPVMTVSGLPNGLSYVDNGNGTASVSGTPAAGDGGKYTVTVTATNSVGTATTSYTLTVDAAPTITSANTTTVVAGSALSFQVTATGYPAPTYTETGTLPAGVSFNKNTGLLSGTPKASAIGTYSLTITATNTIGVSTAQKFSLIVT